MTRDPSDENNNLPPWLRDVPLPPRPRGASDRAVAPAPSAPAAPPSSAGLPDWLHDSSAATPISAADAPSWMDSPAQTSMPAQTSEQAPLPDWLRDSQPAASPSAGSEQLPSWLSDLAGIDSPAQEPPPAPLPDAPPPPEGGLPDWLRDTQQGAVPPSGDEPPPNWLSESDQTLSSAVPPADTPDWLRDLTTEFPAAAEPPAVPDWLGSASEPASNADDIPSWFGAESAPAAPEPPAIPDWLGSSAQAGSSKPSEAESIDLWAPEPDVAPEQPRRTSGDAGVPDWLRDISAEDTGEGEITAEPFTFEDATGTPPRAEPDGPPAWLSGDSSEGVPDWLRSAVDQSEESASAAPELPAVPLWLQDVENKPASSPMPRAPDVSYIPPAVPSAEVPPAADQESVPPWLHEQASQPAPAADVPDWLRASESPVQPPPAADIPAWLQSEPAAQPAPAADVPDWLRESAPPVQPPPAADIPAWLQSEPAAQPAPAADVPDWLRESAPPVQPPPAADIPAWLQSEPAAQPAPAHDDDTLPGIGRIDMAAPSPAPAPSPPADDLPDWLRPSAQSAAPTAAPGQDLPPWLRDEAGQPLPTAGLASDSKLPAWLRGVASDAPSAASALEPPPPPAPANFDWLDQAAEAEARRTPSESEFFGGTELPAWLRPPEQEQPKEISQADARSLDWLTRLGGTEEPDAAVSTTVAAPRLKPLVVRPRSAAQIEALALLQRLAATPFSEPAAMPAPAQPNVFRRVGIERALYLALLIALIIGFIVPLPDSFGLAAAPSAPGAINLFAQIDKLSENDVVLVGYEWDARRSSELRPLEDAVLGHLIQRKVKLVLASTDPQGTLLLFDFRDQLERAGYRKGGEDYILLGYKPGAELALRQFAQDFRSELRSDFQGNDATISALATGTDPNKPRLTSLGDFSMMIVLADEAQDVQGWMEQVHRSAPQVPFAFLLPAETAPVVQPYLTQPGIFHLAGKQGALAYESLRGDGAMPAAQIARETSQQRLSMLLFVILLLAGAIMVGMSTAAARRRRPA